MLPHRVLAPIGVIAVILSAASSVADLYARDALPEVPTPGTWYLMGPQPPAPTSAGVRPGRPSMRGLGWQVMDYLSVMGVLVIDVQTYRVDDASAIARELVDPLASSYAEVLIYFREPGQPLAAARVQWTPSAGYVEIDLSVD